MSRYSIMLQWSEEDQGYVATIPELPNASVVGDTPEIAVSEIQVVAKMYLEVLKEDGMPVPEPRKLKIHSGQLRIRIPRELHSRLVALAKQEGMSLNSYILYLLSYRSNEKEMRHKLWDALHDISDNLGQSVSTITTAMDSIASSDERTVVTEGETNSPDAEALDTEVVDVREYKERRP